MLTRRGKLEPTTMTTKRTMMKKMTSRLSLYLCCVVGSSTHATLLFFFLPLRSFLSFLTRQACGHRVKCWFLLFRCKTKKKNIIALQFILQVFRTSLASSAPAYVPRSCDVSRWLACYVCVCLWRREGENHRWPVTIHVLHFCIWSRIARKLFLYWFTWIIGFKYIKKISGSLYIKLVSFFTVKWWQSVPSFHFKRFFPEFFFQIIPYPPILPLARRFYQRFMSYNKGHEKFEKKAFRLDAPRFSTWGNWFYDFKDI